MQSTARKVTTVLRKWKNDQHPYMTSEARQLIQEIEDAVRGTDGSDDERELVEALANYAHAAWCGWMDYLFSKGIFHDDGTFTMPAWVAERWRRQAATPYDKLPEKEKDSDRVEAETILVTVKKSGYTITRCN